MKFTDGQLLELARKALVIALYPAESKPEFSVYAYVPWRYILEIRSMLKEYGYPIDDTLKSIKKKRTAAKRARAKEARARYQQTIQEKTSV